jgi:hypothetical protein
LANSNMDLSLTLALNSVSPTFSELYFPKIVYYFGRGCPSALMPRRGSASRRQKFSPPQTLRYSIRGVLWGEQETGLRLFLFCQCKLRTRKQLSDVETCIPTRYRLVLQPINTTKKRPLHALRGGHRPYVIHFGD